MNKIIPYLLPQKDAVSLSNLIPSQLFPEDDWTTTGKRLSYWYSASCLAGLGVGREDNWVGLWYLIQWFIRSSCSCLPFFHLLDDEYVSTDSFTMTIFPTLFNACVATASYCKSWSLPGLCLLIFAMYLGRVIFHNRQEGSSSAEELISSYTDNLQLSG